MVNYCCPLTMGFLGGGSGKKTNKQTKKNPPANSGDARDTGLIPGSGRSPVVGKGYPL